MRECVAQFDQDEPQSPIARLFGLHPLRHDARAWYRGALGEQAVARRLAAMGKEWVAIHGIPIGKRGSDTDHLVIGPSGVYTINAKRHTGAKVFAGGGSIRVNGHPTQYVRNAQYEAERVAKMLSAAAGFPVKVTPAVVIVDAAEVNSGTKAPVVAVMTPARLTRWLKRGPRALSVEQIVTLSEAAAHLSTWGSALPAGMSDAEVAHRFLQIDRAVSRAIVRNRLWLAGAVAGGFAISLTVIGPTLTAVVGALF